MRRIVLGVAALAILGTALVAHAASLTVDAGVLQVFHAGGPVLHDLTVVNRIYSGQSGNLHEEVVFGPYSIPEGVNYDLAWTADTHDCPSDTPDPQGVGTDFPAIEGDHYVCSSPPGQPHRGEPIVTVDGVEVQPLE